MQRVYGRRLCRLRIGPEELRCARGRLEGVALRAGLVRDAVEVPDLVREGVDSEDVFEDPRRAVGARLGKELPAGEGVGTRQGRPMAKLTEKQKEFLRNPYVGTVTTLREDGSPHSTVVWVDDVENGDVSFNTAYGRL